MELCNKTAKYFKMINITKIHVKNSIFKIPTLDFKYKTLNKKKLSDLIEFVNEHDISHNKITTKSALLVSTIDEISKNYLELVNDKKVEEFSLIKLGKILERI